LTFFHLITFANIQTASFVHVFLKENLNCPKKIIKTKRRIISDKMEKERHFAPLCLSRYVLRPNVVDRVKHKLSLMWASKS